MTDPKPPRPWMPLEIFAVLGLPLDVGATRRLSPAECLSRVAHDPHPCHRVAAADLRRHRSPSAGVAEAVDECGITAQVGQDALSGQKYHHAAPAAHDGGTN